MILSAIDLGTNTVLMVTIRKDESGAISVLGDEHNIARLGRGVDAERRIGADAFERVAGFLAHYHRLADELGAEKIVAVGTSALRDAANREEFIAAMAEQTRITLTVLSGDDEALLTYRGALFDLPLRNAESIAVIDIGGGSTELAVGDGRAIRAGASIDVGAVRLTERTLGEGPVSPEAIASAREWIRSLLPSLPTLPTGTQLVGVAGTATTLGTMSLGLDHHDPARLHGLTIPHRQVQETIQQIASLPLEQLRTLPGVHPDRADILLAGALILDEVMHQANVSSLTVSVCGLRYGIALQALE